MQWIGCGESAKISVMLGVGALSHESLVHLVEPEEEDDGECLATPRSNPRLCSELLQSLYWDLVCALPPFECFYPTPVFPSPTQHS